MSDESKYKVSQDRIRYIVKHSGWSVSALRAMLVRFVQQDGAQDLAEYGIALAVIGTIAGAVAIAVAVDVGTLWSTTQSVIHLSVH